LRSIPPKKVEFSPEELRETAHHPDEDDGKRLLVFLDEFYRFFRVGIE
jgi:hypothetical protein